MSSDFLSLRDMAAQLGVHPETLRKLHLRGDVRSYKIGLGKRSVIRFDPAEVREDLRKKKDPA